MKPSTKRVLSALSVIALFLMMLPIGIASASAEEITPDTSWYDEHTTDTTYSISTAAQLLGFSKLIAGTTTFAGKTINLENDIDLNPDWTASATAPSNVWTSTGGNTTGFDGIFDGKNHTISGIYMKSDDRAGIFGKQGGNSDNITLGVKNLTILNSYVEGANQYVGGLYGIIKVGNTGKSMILSNLYLDIDLVSQYSPTKSTVAYIGGMVGYVGSGTYTIENCVFAGSVTNTGTYATRIGGLFGAFANQKIQNITIRDTAFYGEMSIAGSDFGFAVGFVEGANAVATRKLTVNNLILAGTRSGGSNAANFSRAIYTEFLTAGGVTFNNLLHTAVFGGVYYEFNGSTYTKISNGTVSGTAVVQPIDLNGLTAVKTLADHSITTFVANPDGGYPLPASVYQMLYQTGETTGSDTVTALVGYQLTAVADAKYSIRLVGTLNLPEETDLADIEKIGFSYTLAKADGTKTDELTAECTVVYESLLGLDGTDAITYDAEDMGGDYLFAFALKGLPTSLGDLTFTVTPFYQLVDGAKVNGTTESFTLTVNNLN